MITALALVIGDVNVSITVPGTVVRTWGLGSTPQPGNVRAHAAKLATRLLQQHGARAGESWIIVLGRDGSARVHKRAENAH